MTVTIRPLNDSEIGLLTRVRTELGQAPRLLPMTAAAFTAYLGRHPSTDPALVGGPPHMAILRRARADLTRRGFLDAKTARDLLAFLREAPPFDEWEIETVIAEPPLAESPRDGRS